MWFLVFESFSYISQLSEDLKKTNLKCFTFLHVCDFSDTEWVFLISGQWNKTKQNKPQQHAMIPMCYKWHLNSLIKDTVKDYFTVNICWSLILNFVLFWQEILQVNSDWHVFYKGYLFFNDYRLFLWFCDKYLTATAHSHNFIWTENTNFSSFCWFWFLNLTSQLVGKKQLYRERIRTQRMTSRFSHVIYTTAIWSR